MATQAPDPEPTYPTLEGFIERATADDIASLFTPLKERLKALKGPRADQGKKAHIALQRTEELLGRLLELRENLAAEKAKKGGKRR
jgi:hypothetical protein